MVVAGGLLVATVVMGLPRFLQLSTVAWNVGWLANVAPFVAAAVFMVRTDLTSRVVGVALFLVAALLVLVAGTGPFAVGHALYGVSWVAVDVAGLAGWFVLRRRPSVCYLLLAVMAIVGYLWDVNGSVASTRDRLLHDAGLGSAVTSGAWSWTNAVLQVALNADMAVAVLLAFIAAVWSRRYPAPGSSGVTEAPEVAYGSGSGAGAGR